MTNSITNENDVLDTNSDEIKTQSISSNITIEKKHKKHDAHVEHVSEALRNKINSDLHVMAKNLKTIKEIWNECKCGVNGHPSLRSSQSAHGRKWRNDPSGCSKTKHLNRASVCLEVVHLIKTGLLEKDAALQSR